MIHARFLLGYERFSFHSQGFFEIRQEDVSISYLPLAHMFERMIQVKLSRFLVKTPDCVYAATLDLLIPIRSDVKGRSKGL